MFQRSKCSASSRVAFQCSSFVKRSAKDLVTFNKNNGIWISEIMCQQTRVAAVVPYWLKWMESFPTVQSLANATEEQVNSHWAGLGFYRRARMLHQGSQFLVDKHSGKLPRTVEELLEIPGIGRYTASAIASIAFGVCVPVVDGNVCRLLARLKGICQHIKAPVLKDKLGWELALQIVQAGDGLHTGEVNQALMELGATYCAPSGTGIEEEDPLRDYYRSTKLGAAYYTYTQQQPKPKNLQSMIQKAKTNSSTDCALCQTNSIAMVLEQLEEAIQGNDSEKDPYQEARSSGHSVFPMAPPKQTKREEVLAVAVLSSADDEGTYWLLVKRPKKGLLAGQWEFPSACVWSSEDTKGGKKRKSPSVKPGAIQVPTVAATVRQKAVSSLLDDILSQDEILRGQVTHKTLKKLKGPLEHIFSHVRHTYAIEYGSTSTDTNSGQELTWTSATGREVRWMRQSDMKQAGVTSGVLKILKAVQEEEQKAKKKQGFFQPKKKSK